MSNIETEKDEMIANWVFACCCMMTSAQGTINAIALDWLKQEILKQCNEKECTLPIVAEKIVDDGISRFKLHTEIIGDDYYISLERVKKRSHESDDIDKDYDKQEIYINRDCMNAYVINTMGNHENCYSYEKTVGGYTYMAVLLEHLSTGTEELTESQRALLKDAYEVLDVEGLSHKRVMIPYESDRENGCFANEYGCADRGHKYLSFSKGELAVRYTETNIKRGFRQEVWIMTSKDKTSLIVRLNGIEVPYEKCDLSEEAIEFFKKIARVLKNHEFDVSELPAGFTDSVQIES